MEFISTKRGARSLIYGGHRYLINRRGRDDQEYWHCALSRGCSGTITTQGDQILTIKDTHNHPPDEAKIQADKIISNLKKRTTESIQPVPLMYQDELQKLSMKDNRDEIAARLPTFTSVKSALYRQRHKRLPSMPQLRCDVQFSGEWAETSNGNPFFLADSGEENKIVIFATEKNLQMLSEADTIFMDGTFHTCPQLFYQNFTVHAFR